MGRKAALTPDQLIKIEQRHLLNGESINSLAKEFKVNEATIRKKIKPNKSEDPKSSKPLQVLASEKVVAEVRLKRINEQITELPPERQRIVNTLAQRLSNVSESLACAAELGAATAHRMSALANQEAQKIDDADPLASGEAMLGIAKLNQLANDSSKIALDLLKANKDQIADLTKPEERRVMTLDEFYGGK